MAKAAIAEAEHRAKIHDAEMRGQLADTGRAQLESEETNVEVDIVSADGAAREDLDEVLGEALLPLVGPRLPAERQDLVRREVDAAALRRVEPDAWIQPPGS